MSLSRPVDMPLADSLVTDGPFTAADLLLGIQTLRTGACTTKLSIAACGLRHGGTSRRVVQQRTTAAATGALHGSVSDMISTRPVSKAERQRQARGRCNAAFQFQLSVLRSALAAQRADDESEGSHVQRSNGSISNEICLFEK